MGKGDIKSGKGKRTAGSYGKTRLRKKDKAAAPAAKAEKTEKVAEVPAEKKAPAVKKAPAAKKTTKKESTEE